MSGRLNSLMKREYHPPKIAKHESLEAAPEELQRKVQVDPSLFHEILNLLQVITGQCDLMEPQTEDSEDRVRTIRKAALKITDRLKQSRKSA